MPQNALAVLFADAHSQESAWAGSAIRGDAYYAMQQIVDYTIAKEIRYLFGAGDLIDQQRNRAAPVTRLHAELVRLWEAGGVMFYVQGQHELDDPPWLFGCPSAQHLDQQAVELDGVRIYGLDFCLQPSLQPRLDAIPDGTQLLICHQTWSEWMGDIAAPQGSLAQIPVVSHVFSGDCHKYHLTKLRGKDGQLLTAISPGATCKQAIDEPNEHYFMVLTSDLQFKRVKLKSRPCYEWPVLNRPEDMEQLMTEFEGKLAELRQQAADLQLPEQLCRPLIRFTYGRQLGFDVTARIEKLVARRAHLFWRELADPDREQARRQAAQRVQQRSGELTPLGMLGQVVDSEQEPEVYQLLAGLLQAQQEGRDPAATLERFRQEFLQEPQETACTSND